MLAKKSKRALSEYRKVTPLPPKSIERKKITAQIAGREKTRSLKNSCIIKPFPREKTEEKLRETERFLNNIFASIQDGISIFDKDMNIIRVNEAMERWYSHAMPLVGKKCYEAYHGRKERCNVCPTHQTVLAGKAAYEVVPKVGPDGKIVGWLDLYSFPLIDTATERMSGVIEYVRDITERKRAEDAMRENEENYRSLVESARDAIFTLSPTGTITSLNSAFEKITGWSLTEWIGKSFASLLHPDDLPIATEFFQRALQGEMLSTFELRVLFKSGEYRFGEFTTTPRIEKGRMKGVLGIARDITERKRAEEEMKALEEQLRQSRKMEAVGRLAGGIAHDFNNLLTVIKGCSQLSLFDLKESDPRWVNIQEIEKAAQRATDLTRQLLAFSRRQTLNPKVLDLNTLIKDLEKMLRRLIGEDIELITLLSADLGKVKVDPSQFEQVIFNLAVNARDAMPTGGKLTIETANVELDEKYAHMHVGVVPGRYVRLSVSDTGVGMTREVKEKVFEPFFTTKEKGKGTGLGLSTVYGIVKQSGGNIWFYSEPGRGTTFRIYFPRTEEEADTLHEREETDSFPRGSETVLLVEDDELVRDLATRLLEQQGYTVLKAANGQEALRVAKEHVGKTIHLLLADIVMPQMGGKELADWLKISRPNVKVLYTSGYADNAIVHHGVLDPGTHFLQKPFSLKTLSHKVREVLDR